MNALASDRPRPELPGWMPALPSKTDAALPRSSLILTTSNLSANRAKKADHALFPQEASRRGARFLTVDARPMSRPILERIGFKLLTFANALNWRM